MFHPVPVLPVVVPLGALAWVCLLLVLHRRGSLTPVRALLALAACGYGAGVVAHTVFPIFLDKPASTMPWTAMVDLVPLVGYEPADAAMNVAVFLPLGVVLALVGAAPRRVVLVAAGLSLGIELTQLVTAATLGGGHVADVDDLLFDVLGACLGLGLVEALRGARHRAVVR